MKVNQSRKSEVLFIDDQPEEPMKKMMITTIQSFGFSVFICQKWSETLFFLKSCYESNTQLPEIALIDIHFGSDFLEIGNDENQEGLLIIRRLLEQFSIYGLKPPHITAYTSINSLLQTRMALEYGANDFISAKDFFNPKNIAYRIYLSIFERIGAAPEFIMTQDEERETDALIAADLLSMRNNDINEAAKIMNVENSYIKSLKERYPSIMEDCL